MYEISIVMRNRDGSPIEDSNGNLKRKYFQCERSDQLWDFWNRNSLNHKGGRKKKKGGGAPPKKMTDGEVARVMEDVNSYAEKITKKKRKFDDEDGDT